VKFKERLAAELRSLESELKFELPRELKKALEHGDLRENAEYQSALQRQEFVRARISQIHKQLSDLSRINFNKLPRDRAAYGSTVTLKDLESGDVVRYRLVIGDEVDPEKGLISLSSPIGSSLIGKQEGDEVKVATPAKNRHFEIVKLVTIHDEAENVAQ
jgi:transcription elongation factor GreA